MKILKQVDVGEWSLRVTCDSCDSELQVEANDVNHQYHEGYDQREPAWDEYYAFCPVCSTKIGFSEDKIPKVVKVKLKSKARYGGPFDR